MNKNELLTEVVAAMTRQIETIFTEYEVTHDEQACLRDLEQVIRAGGTAP